MYLRPLGAVECLSYITAGILTTCFLLLMVATLNYIVSLHNKLDLAKVESIKLLNGMHEGVLIINKPKQLDSARKVLFCNKSANKLIQTYLGAPYNDPQWMDT